MPAAPLHRHPVLEADLTRVEETLRGSVVTDDEFLTEVASHLIEAGGKRVRPLFSVACSAVTADTLARATDDAVRGGVSVELVHIGSLYHDDVMDDATTRRTVQSVNARWGNLRAILAGDFLLARASEIAASLGTDVAGLLAATIAKLCEGQVRELQTMFDPTRTEEAYLASITGKTASLFAAACRIGAIVGDLERSQIDSVTTFGHHYGLAFQMVDDVLDVIATDEQLGKPAGNDLVEGVYTLPVIRAMALPGGDELGELLRQPLATTSAEAIARAAASSDGDPPADLVEPVPLGAPEVARAREIARANGGVDSALESARDQVGAAVAALAPFNGSEAATALAGAAEHLLTSVTDIAAANHP
ncbi:MAG: polyprenyl synthetase family protein [Acidimicrobiales bacterium]|nr:polyprenyl synthetase family protein [Acidimicrobiales bacterium]